MTAAVDLVLNVWEGTYRAALAPGFLEDVQAQNRYAFARTVIVEDASRFARDLVTQELGVLALIKRGVTVLTASGDDLTASDDPFKKAMRQIAGAFAELEKARLVGKLKHARDRIRREQGRCEGRKPHAIVSPEAVLLAKRLRRAHPKTGNRLSLRQISAKLAEAGFLNERGQSYNPASIKSMLDGARPATFQQTEPLFTSAQR